MKRKLTFMVSSPQELLKLKPELWRQLKTWRVYKWHPATTKLEWLLRYLPTHTLRGLAFTFISNVNRILMRGRIIFEVELD